MCAEINEGYVERLSRLVSFNGQRVVNMAHLQTLVDTALEVQPQSQRILENQNDLTQPLLVKSPCCSPSCLTLITTHTAPE